MKSVITAIDEVSPDNQRRCSMHTRSSTHCSGPVVAVVTFDDAGGKDNHYPACSHVSSLVRAN
ncbi:hypothetical protein [Streptomyces sp. NPDC003514]